MTETPTRYRANPNTATQSVDSEVFVVTSDNRFHNLKDPVATFLWTSLEGAPLTLTELVERVLVEFEVTEETATNDVQEFVEQGCAQGLFTEV